MVVAADAPSSLVQTRRECRCHFEVGAEELHRRIFVGKHQPILPPNANIHFAGKAGSPRNDFGTHHLLNSSALVHASNTRRAGCVDGPGDDEFALGLPLYLLVRFFFVVVASLSLLTSICFLLLFGSIPSTTISNLFGKRTAQSWRCLSGSMVRRLFFQSA